MRIAVATGAITVDDLRADVLIATHSAHITVDHTMPGALAWRLGAGLLRAYVRGIQVDDVADGIVADASEAEQWLAARSALALDSAAMLIRSRGGDALERAEFARLFAIGEPQEGLAAFLEKRPPRFLK